MSKGSGRRPGEGYEYGWDRIFSNCANCAMSLPTQVYPQMACVIRNELMQASDKCEKWEKK